MLDESKYAIAERLAEIIRSRTISHLGGTGTDWSQFDQLENTLRKNYPLFHSAAELIRVEQARVYRLMGEQSGNESGKLPALWMAHMDVVDAPDEASWTHPPFKGYVDRENNCLWGRGALDMKGQLVSMFEAAEAMLSRGIKPDRDIYISLGPDEEVVEGDTQALLVARYFEENEIKFSYVVDESTNSFFDGEAFGVEGQIVVLGVAEKGYAVVSVKASDTGGHASTPCAHTSLGRAAKAAYEIECAPFAATLRPPTSNMIESLAPRMSEEWKSHYKDEDWICQRLAQDRYTNALVRSTAALTQAEASAVSNVLPTESKMKFNVRIAPWDNIGDLVEHMRKAAGKDVCVALEDGQMPTPISSMTSEGYERVKAAVEKCFADCAFAPNMMLAATDSHYFYNVCDSVYRFTPFRCYKTLGSNIHARDERIDIDSLAEGVQFFMTLYSIG